jgi:nucleoside transporter
VSLHSLPPTAVPSSSSPISVLMLVRLSAMMLLEFIVFGSWFATLGLVLATYKLPTIIGDAYSLAAVAAIFSPLCLGAIGDRFLAAQKVLGLAHLVGGALMLFMPGLVQSGKGSSVLMLIFVYMLFFMPTLGLTNTIAFRHLEGNQRMFPYVRVFGTFGWVVAGIGVGALGLSASTGVFTVAGIASFVLAAYSFTLPSTPPPAKGEKFSIADVFGAKAFVLFRHRNFTVLIICALLTSICLGVYNAFASPYLGALGISNVAGVLAIGQASEVIFIVTIPFVLSRIGMKWGLLAGMGMWGVRFLLFMLAAHGHAWFAIVGVAVQGICNDFFLILSAMYIDRVAPVDLAAQAQGWLIMVISGFGGAIGGFVGGQVYGAAVASHPDAGPTAWTPLWLVPIGAAILTGILWVCFFRYSRREEIVRFDPAATGVAGMTGL